MKRLIFLLFVISSFNLFGQAPPFKWVKKIPFEILSQCVDNEDNIYIAGIFQVTIDFENITLTSNNNSSDIIIAKYDSSGNLIWYKQFGGRDDDCISDIKIDNNNDLIVTDIFNGTTIFEGDTITAGTQYRHGVIIAKLSNNGDVIWVKVPGYNDNGCLHVFSTAIGPQNDILISGDIEFGNGIFSDTIIPSLGLIPGFLAKYNSDGEFEWVRKFDDMIYQSTFDMSNNILLISDSMSKYSNTGELLWKRNINVAFSDMDYWVFFWPRIVADSMGNFYLATYFNDTLVVGNDTLFSSANSCFVFVKFNPQGIPVFGSTFEGTSVGGSTSAFIKNNRIFTTGKFRGKIFFNNDSLVSLSPWFSSVFIAEFDLTGNLIFIKKVDSKHGCSPGLVSVGKSIYLSGHSGDTTYFDNIVINNGCFLARIQDEVASQNIIPETFDIYPSPFRSNININYNPAYKDVTLEIYNLQGALMKRYLLNHSINNINLDYLSNGFYIIKIITEKSVMCKKIEKV